MPQLSTKPSSNPLALSAEDVDRLLHDTTSGTRVDMTNKIGGAYSVGAQLTPKETMIAEQVFRLLMRDTEIAVRAQLAQHLKDSGQVPHDIIKSLASDVDEVSLPILEFSTVLTDDDLLDLVNATEQVSKYLAISRRRVVPEAVAESLINKGNEQVAASLVSNAGAKLSEKSYDKIITTYKNNDAVMQSLSARAALPVTVVEKMVSVVSTAVVANLKKKYKLSGGQAMQVDKDAEKTREKETLNLIRVAQAEEDIDKLIAHLRGAGKLTPSIILSALCQGDFNFFEMSLAKLSDIPVSNARKLISDKGDLGFRAIYNKSGLPDAMFPAVKLLLSIVRELHAQGAKSGSTRYANSIVERILQHSGNANMENLSYIIALVRQSAQ